MAGIVDISDEKRPRMLSLFPLPEPAPESELKNFYEKAGRFGPHNHHHPNHQACLEDRDDIAYLTYFNAGLRVYDIRDARQPKEIGLFRSGRSDGANRNQADPARRPIRRRARRPARLVFI